MIPSIQKAKLPPISQPYLHTTPACTAASQRTSKDPNPAHTLYLTKAHKTQKPFAKYMATPTIKE
jgi:hypothetical protein